MTTRMTPMLFLAALCGCEETPPPVDVADLATPADMATPCTGPQCPAKVSEPVTVAKAPGQVSVRSVVLALSADGQNAAVAWNEISGSAEKVQVGTSSDGAKTFSAPVRLDAAATPALSYPHLVYTSGGLFASVMPHTPDPGGPDEPWHAWLRLYHSADNGKTFQQQSDLKAQLGERSFIESSLTSSADGKTVVLAWVDQTPAGWLGGGAPPSDALLAAVSTDSGKTFAAPKVVSASPTLVALRVSAFLRSDRPGVLFGELRALTGYPAKVGFPALSVADQTGVFGAPKILAPDAYGVLAGKGSYGLDPGAYTGAAPAAAIGKDGSIHAVWWSVKTVGLWYSSSADAATFSTPARVFATADPAPSNVRVAVDGSGTAWIVALDGDRARVVRVRKGRAPEEIESAAVTVGALTDPVDVAALPADGVIVSWVGTPPEDGSSMEQPILVRRIGP